MKDFSLEIPLTPFTHEQVQDLTAQHGLHLSVEQLQSVMQLMQGHPHLVRLLLYHLVQQQQRFDVLLEAAHTDSGIYAAHLHRHLWNLQHYPDLGDAFRSVLQSREPIELEQVQAFKLHSMGLVSLVGNRVAVTCDLYWKYFCDRLLCQPSSV